VRVDTLHVIVTPGDQESSQFTPALPLKQGFSRVSEWCSGCESAPKEQIWPLQVPLPCRTNAKSPAPSISS
jgi:hypothetical protein